MLCSFERHSYVVIYSYVLLCHIVLRQAVLLSHVMSCFVEFILCVMCNPSSDNQTEMPFCSASFIQSGIMLMLANILRGVFSFLLL